MAGSWSDGQALFGRLRALAEEPGEVASLVEVNDPRTESVSDRPDIGHGAVGNSDDEVVRGIREHAQVSIVQSVEQTHGDPTQTLVAVDKGMPGDDRME